MKNPDCRYKIRKVAGLGSLSLSNSSRNSEKGFLKEAQGWDLFVLVVGLI